jgi:hypothetical protein
MKPPELKVRGASPKGDEYYEQPLDTKGDKSFA